MPEGVQAVVLCEDVQGWVFVRRMLIALGFDSHRIRVIPYPADGRGCGEQHVRERYPEELARYRTRAARTKVVLVVHTDADKLTVEERLGELEKQLASTGVPSRGPKEAVALLIPKREIETWIHCLAGTPVDEDTSYPKFTRRESDTWAQAETFAEYVCNPERVIVEPLSLLAGLAEARRLL